MLQRLDPAGLPDCSASEGGGVTPVMLDRDAHGKPFLFEIVRPELIVHAAAEML